jgi:hypothetical protein
MSTTTRLPGLPELTEVATPAAIGWRWRRKDVTYEVSWVRDTHMLMLASMEDGVEEWSDPFAISKIFQPADDTEEAARNAVTAFLMALTA